MTYKLFIDDQRFPIKDNEFEVARNSQAAIDLVIKFGLPEEIAFDHDLGGNDTSMIFCRWLQDYMLDNDLKFPKHFKYSIHSQNPVGKANIDSFMSALIKYIGYNE